LIHAEKGHLAFDFVGEQGNVAGKPALSSLQGGQVANMVPPSAQAILKGVPTGGIVDVLSAYNRVHESQIEAISEGRDTLLQSAGVAAHAALPHLGRNAIMQLVGFLDTLSLQPSGASAFLSFLQEKIGMETDGKSLGLACSDPVSGALTLNVGVILGADQELRVRIDIRYPISARADDLLEILRRQVGGRGLGLECIRITEPLYVALDDPLVTALLRVYEAQTGLEGKPLAIGGRTYASAMPHVVAFGPLFPGEPDLAHQIDECISLDNLRRLTSIYAQAILELAR
jgi:succinyl-diaminopimelate desuccinylase